MAINATAQGASGKLAILVWSIDAERPELCAAPFVYAAVAAAMDAEVELHFAGRAVRFLIEGEAAAVYPGRDREKSLYAFMQDAASGGARFVACSMALREHVADSEKRIPEYSGAAGAAAFVMRSLDAEWRTLVF